MNKRFRKIFALIICLIIIATTCATSASAALVNSVECVCKYYNIAVWKAKSTVTQNYISLRVEYYQVNTTNNVRSTTSAKDVRYNVASLNVTCYPDEYNTLDEPRNVKAEFANGGTVYPQSINDEII